MEKESKIRQTADRIVELDKEVEASGHIAVDEASLVRARAVLHQWIDEMQGIVVNPALGRVSVIHADGFASSIASADLAFKMSAAGITRSGQK